MSIKRYHWCKGEFLGYEDDSNTYYIVPDREGSTKVIIDDSQGVINRIEYDHLGKIRNQAASPQVELLWRGWFYNTVIGEYFITDGFIYNPILGFSLLIKESFIKTFIPIPFKKRYQHFSENQTMDLQTQLESTKYDPNAFKANRLGDGTNPYYDEAHPIRIGYRNWPRSSTSPCYLHTVDWSDGTTTHLPDRGGSRCLTRGEAEAKGALI